MMMIGMSLGVIAKPQCALVVIVFLLFRTRGKVV